DVELQKNPVRRRVMKRNVGPTLVLMGLRENRFSQVCLMEIMKRILTRFESVTTLVSRSLSLVGTGAPLCAVSVSPASSHFMRRIRQSCSGEGFALHSFWWRGGSVRDQSERQ